MKTTQSPDYCLDQGKSSTQSVVQKIHPPKSLTSIIVCNDIFFFFLVDETLENPHKFTHIFYSANIVHTFRKHIVKNS